MLAGDRAEPVGVGAGQLERLAVEERERFRAPGSAQPASAFAQAELG